MKKYIAKPNTWFKEGTECKLLVDYGPPWNMGVFEGIRICENPLSEGGHLIGSERLDEEQCSFVEFEIIDDQSNL